MRPTQTKEPTWRMGSLLRRANISTDPGIVPYGLDLLFLSVGNQEREQKVSCRHGGDLIH